LKAFRHRPTAIVQVDATVSSIPLNADAMNLDN